MMTSAVRKISSDKDALKTLRREDKLEDVRFLVGVHTPWNEICKRIGVSRHAMIMFLKRLDELELMHYFELKGSDEI